MKTIYCICIIGVLVLIPIKIHSQTNYSIKGEVYGEKELLIGANVVLKETSNNPQTFGASTDERGAYHIQVPKGKYDLEISYIGYAKYTAHIEVNGNVNLPPIQLSENSQQMEAVVITAKTITYNTNGYIAEISKNPLYREQDMNSILKLSPGTNTTTKGIQVYGQDVSKVYVNGRELRLSGEQLINYLSTLEGKNVKQMEVIAASGVDEDASTMGSSIIKITTINPETGGMLNVGGMAMLGVEGRYTYMPNIMLNWRLGKKWATYFNGNASYYKRPNGYTIENHFYDTDIHMLNESDGKWRQKGSYNALWGISYDWDEKNLFSLEASYNSSHSSNESYEVVRKMEDGHTETTAEGNTENDNNFWGANLSFTYTHKFNSNSELDFQTDYLRQSTEALNYNQYLYSEGSNQFNNNLSDEEHTLYTARMDYTQRLKKGNGVLKMGIKYSNISDEQDMDYAYFVNNQKDSERSYLDLYKYSEEVYAAYAQYSFKAGRFDFNTGLRLEHALLSPQSSSNPERNQESTHTDWAPELGISYALNKEKGHNIALQYNRSISRPFFSFLNPRIIRHNEYYYWSGNPLLRPTVTDRYSLRATFFNGYTLAFNRSYTNDGIIDLPQSIDGVIYSTPQTGMESTHYSVYAGIPLKLRQWGRLNFSVTYDYAEQAYQNDQKSSDQWRFNLSGLFQLPKDINLNMNLSHSTPMKSLYGETRSNMMASLRVSKLFLKRSLNVSLMFNDLFNSSGSMVQEYYYNDHSRLFKSTKHGFFVNLNVRYTLRWGQKSAVRRGGSGNTEESFRLNSN
ncbi:MAG: TonB-dependent receptor [Bacteroides sp.]|nr:TonB-dependent receptor [Bacteroides sp.]